MGQAKRRGTFEERRDLAVDMNIMRRAREDAQADKEYAERHQDTQTQLRGSIGRGGMRGLVLAAAALACVGMGIARPVRNTPQ